MSEQPPPYPGSDRVPPGSNPQGPPPPPQGPPQYPAPAQPQPGQWPPPPPGGGYPPPYYPGGTAPEQQPSKTMAIIALVLAIVPCGITWLVAIVLAIIVLVRSKSGQVRGKGLAIAALVISVLWIVVAVIAGIVIVAEVTKYDDNRDANEGTVRSSMLRTGDCLAELPSGEEISTVEIIPCTKEHAGEVYSVFSLEAGDNPSQNEIYDQARGECETRLDGFVASGAPKNLEYSFIAPDKDAIELDDDVACYVYEPGRTSTGSLGE